MQRELVYVTIRAAVVNHSPHAELPSDITADVTSSIRAILNMAHEDGELNGTLNNQQLNVESFEVMEGLPEREE